MAFGRLREKMSNRKAEKAEESRRQQEDRERMVAEKEEVSLLFDGLSNEGKIICLKLLAETMYVLVRSSIKEDGLENKEDVLKLRRILSMIKFWGVLDKHDCLTRLCTKYNIAQTFSKSQKDAEDEDEEFEIMCNNLVIAKEEKRIKKEEKRKRRKEKRQERRK